MQKSHIVGWPKVAVLLVGKKCDLYYGSLLNCLYFRLLPATSHYNTSAVNPLHQYHDTRALEGVWRAMWQVGLAMLAKAVLCIFTFGIKVLTSAKLDNFRCLRAA